MLSVVNVNEARITMSSVMIDARRLGFHELDGLAMFLVMFSSDFPGPAECQSRLLHQLKQIAAKVLECILAV